jgi:hypothetical protein
MRARSALLLALPPLTAIVLAITCFGTAFIGDDFAFVTRAQRFTLDQLLPDPRSIFYRPVSREIYFGFLALIGKDNPFWGHLFNAVFAALSVLLVTLLARRLAGWWTGLLAGLLFAALGALPLSIDWVSCSQDILTAFLLLAALNLQLRGRLVAALACTALALLSKEAALYFLPSLIGLRWLLTRRRPELVRDAIAYSAIAAVWAATHPIISSLLERRLATGSGGYVGLDNHNAWRNMKCMVASVVNISPDGLKTPWPGELTIPFLVALGLFGLAFWSAGRIQWTSAAPDYPTRRVLVVALLILIPPLILIPLTAKHWLPSYAILPGIGMSVLLAILLGKTNRAVAIFAAVLFLTLGVWFRGAVLWIETMPTERNFRVISPLLQRVESQLESLHPSLPDSTRLWVTVQMNVDTPLAQVIREHLIDAQAARVWYWNPTLATYDLQDFRRRPGPSYFFWVNPSGNLFEILYPSLVPRSAGPRVDPLEHQVALRNLAFGLYGAGDVNGAVAILLRLPAAERRIVDFDRRLATMLLFASGRDAEADRLRRTTMPLPPEEAVDALAAALGPTIPGVDRDAAGFRAFDVPLDDPAVYRELMNTYSDQALIPQTLRMAQRLLALKPDDEEAREMIEAVNAVPKWEQVLVPVEVEKP